MLFQLGKPFSNRVKYPEIGTVVTLGKRMGGKVIDIKYDPDPIIQIQIRQNALEPFQAQLHGLGIESDRVHQV